VLFGYRGDGMRGVTGIESSELRASLLMLRLRLRSG
jgi:hypothetical protein